MADMSDELEERTASPLEEELCPGDQNTSSTARTSSAGAAATVLRSVQAATVGRASRRSRRCTAWRHGPKWYAWDKVRQLDPADARQQYVRLLDELAPSWCERHGSPGAPEPAWVSVSRPKRLSECSLPDDGTARSLVDRIKADDLDGVRAMLGDSGEAAALVNGLDDEGMAAIHWAADRGNVEILTRLLAVDGIDINLRGADGQTALHYASSCGNVECLQLLLQHGADRTIRDEEGETCSDVAYNQAIKACLA
uniref:Acyl-CoA-binding domain-containing protein 6 n=1 Tax=Anopheles coluzzii TaxID=1518534 RepID=A0A8W7Q4P4_ANOCL